MPATHLTRCARREVQSHPEFRRTPVLMKDWVVHPLQLADAVDCGAVGVIGAVCQVTSPKGTLTLSQYGTSRGLDMPIEVVNAAELKAMEQGGVTLYAFVSGRAGQGLLAS